MALLDITSANSTLRIIVPAIFPGGFDVNDYSADRMFETAALQNKETVMGADGKFHAGKIFNPAELTLSLMPTSTTGQYLDQWFAAENASLSSYECNATLVIPSMDATYNFVSGVLYTWNPTPGAGRVMQARSAVFQFQSVTRS